MTAGEKLAAAKRAEIASRERLAATAATLQERLQPSTLASSAWDGARTRGEELADEAIAAARERPAVAAGVVAAAALFLARKPLTSALFSRLRRDRDELNQSDA